VKRSAKAWPLRCSTASQKARSMAVVVIGVSLVLRHAREGGHPVRRGPSAQSRPLVEYWIARLRGQ
jgi:hypothetical protein